MHRAPGVLREGGTGMTFRTHLAPIDNLTIAVPLGETNLTAQ